MRLKKTKTTFQFGVNILKQAHMKTTQMRNFNPKNRTGQNNQTDVKEKLIKLKK